MNNRERCGEFEFDLRTIIKQMLDNIKWFIVFMLLGAILLPVCVGNMKNESAIMNIEDIAITDADKLQMHRYEICEGLVENQKEYMKKHRNILEIEPESAGAYVLQYIFVDTEMSNYNIKSAFLSKIIGDKDITSGGAPYVLSEWNNVLVINDAENIEDTLYIKIYMCDENYIDEIKEQLKVISDEINEMGLTHDLILIKEYVQDDYDYQLARFQKNTMDEYNNFVTQRDREKTLLSANAIKYNEFQKNGYIPSVQLSKKEVVIYAAIGLLAGGMVVAMAILIRYICSKTPNTATDVQSIWGIELLAKTNVSKMKMTDSLIDNLFGDNEKKYTEKEWIGCTCERLFENVNSNEILVIDLTDLEEEIDVSNLLNVSKDTQFNLKRYAGKAIENRNDLKMYKEIVFLIKKNATLYSRIAEWLDVCEDTKIRVIGYCVIE